MQVYIHSNTDDSERAQADNDISLGWFHRSGVYQKCKTPSRGGGFAAYVVAASTTFGQVGSVVFRLKRCCEPRECYEDLVRVNESVPPDGRPGTVNPFVQSRFPVAGVVVDTGDQMKLPSAAAYAPIKVVMPVE